MRLTEPQRRALEIVREHGPDIPPRAFARLMWPDDGTLAESGAPRWKLEGRGAQGGVARGRSMWLKGGQMLSNLRRRGLLSGGFGRDGSSRGYRWYLTEEAEEALR